MASKSAAFSLLVLTVGSLIYPSSPQQCTFDIYCVFDKWERRSASCTSLPVQSLCCLNRNVGGTAYCVRRYDSESNRLPASFTPMMTQSCEWSAESYAMVQPHKSENLITDGCLETDEDLQNKSIYTEFNVTNVEIIRPNESKVDVLDKETAAQFADFSIAEKDDACDQLKLAASLWSLGHRVPSASYALNCKGNLLAATISHKDLWHRMEFSAVSKTLTIKTGFSFLNLNFLYTASFSWPNRDIVEFPFLTSSCGKVTFDLSDYQGKSNQWNEVATVDIRGPCGSEPIHFSGQVDGNKVIVDVVLNTTGPCGGNYQLLDEPWRKLSFVTDPGDEHTDGILSDTGFVAADVWNRIDDTLGGQMSETCPPSLHVCGTDAPGWLQGTHPIRFGVETPDKGCFLWEGNCCNWSTDVKVLRCGTFYVYNLPLTPVSYLAYCGRG